mgnify:CR=1 FL=1
MKDTILITGASSGLGNFLSNKFKSQGHRVLEHMGRQHYNLNNLEHIHSLAEDAKKENVNVLINNAAIVCPDIPFEEYDVDLIESMLGVNLAAPIMLSFLLINQLSGIININSMVGLEVKKPRTLYSATKWGLRGFSNSLKLEKECLNILDVYPTNIRTTPDRKNAMDVEMVVDKIYQSYRNKEEELILDGRKK